MKLPKEITKFMIEKIKRQANKKANSQIWIEEWYRDSWLKENKEKLSVQIANKGKIWNSQKTITI